MRRRGRGGPSRRGLPERIGRRSDGDRHSLDLAAWRAEDHGVAGRVDFIESSLEEMETDGDFTLVTNNISMHECRDIDEATARIHYALEPGGWFAISDLPFPDSTDALRTLPGRVMSGIQFWKRR